MPGDPDALNSDFVTSILRARNGDLWIGTWGNGLNLLRPQDEIPGRFDHYVNQAGDPSSLANDYVSSIIEDRQGNLWFGTRGGIVMHRPGSQVFEYVS
ncbi:unnamed protein product, partial [marine sediment metagenome]